MNSSATEQKSQQLSLEEVSTLFRMPLLELIFKAATVHREHFDATKIQKSKLISIKTGACPENCRYCSQSARYQTDVERQKLFDSEEVLADARAAQNNGADRFCMGAAWREVRNGEEFEAVKNIISEVKALGLETCATLGMLDESQAQELKESGLDYYNHNIDTSPEHYKNVVSTRSFQDRLQTIKNVQQAGLNVCSGGILGLGETDEDRISFLHTLASMNPPPQSVPINNLVPVEGTPFAKNTVATVFEMARVIACARILMPESYVRLSAGRMNLSDEGQALCFLAGANSIFSGDKLLTTPNSGDDDDSRLFDLLGLSAEKSGS